MTDQINEKQTSLPQKKKCFASPRSKVILAVLIVVVLVITIKGIAVAQQMHRHGGDPIGMLIGRISEKLDLSEAQKQQLEKIRNDIHQKMENGKQDRESDFEAFANEFRNSSIDKNKLIEIAEKREKEREEMRSFMLDKLVEFHSLLTPEQRSKAMDEMKNMKDKFGPDKRPGDRQDRDSDDRFRKN